MCAPFQAPAERSQRSDHSGRLCTTYAPASRAIHYVANFLPLLSALILPLACFRLLVAAVKAVCSIYSAPHRAATSPLSDCPKVPLLDTLSVSGEFLNHIRTFLFHVIRVDSNANHTYSDSATTSSILSFPIWGRQTLHYVIFTPSQIRTFTNLRSSTTEYQSIK